MFDIELTRLVLKRKQDELQSIQSNQTTNQDKIDALNKQINYLKATIIRYEIAKLLGLSNDEEYISNNFLGIESENVNDYNLSPDKLIEYNNLIASLPPEQFQRYRYRKQIAKIVGPEVSEKYKKNDYVGIEKINPNLDRLNLSDEQINNFNILVSNIQATLEDSTIRVDIAEETINLLNETFNKINVEDLREYDRLKTIYMDTLEKILDHIKEESRRKIHATAANCNIAIDLREKYPELDIILNVNAAKQLLELIENSQLEEEKYNDYLNYLCDNINKLYQDENNRVEIERLLNSIDRNNYILRDDLNRRLNGINDNKLELQDDEIETLFRLLDNNYDNLPEKERERYYEILETKLSKEINDLDKINDINKLFLSIKNKSFEERLQNKFANIDTVKFSHQHYTSHKGLIQDQIKELRKKIQEYESKKPKTGMVSSFYEAKIKDLEKEIAKLESIDEHTFNSGMLNVLDANYNNKTDKVILLRKEIKELQALKSKVNSRFHQRLIDKRIEARNKKLKKLKNSKNKIVGQQKKIMTPRLYLDRKQGMVSRHFESKSEVFNEYADGYQKMAETERNLNGMFSSIKAAFYDLKANRYRNKAEFNRDICEILRGGNVTVKGRNKQRIKRTTLDQIRDRQQQQIATQVI